MSPQPVIASVLINGSSVGTTTRSPFAPETCSRLERRHTVLTVPAASGG